LGNGLAQDLSKTKYFEDGMGQNLGKTNRIEDGMSQNLRKTKFFGAETKNTNFALWAKKQKH